MTILFTTIFGLIVALGILILVRRDQLEPRQGISWLVVASGFGLLGFAPALVDTVSRRLDIAHAPSLAFSIALGLITLKLLSEDIQASRLNVRLKRAIQRLGILEAELRELRAKEDSTSLDSEASEP